MDDFPPDLCWAENIAAADQLLRKLTLSEILGVNLAQACRVHRAMFNPPPEGEPYIEGRPGSLKERKTFIPLDGGRYLHHSAPEDVLSDYQAFLRSLPSLQEALPGLKTTPSTPKVAINKLVYVAMFHVNFVKIHPFQDGNGRIARAIAFNQLFHLLGDELKFFPKVNYQRQGVVEDGEALVHPYFNAFFYRTALSVANINIGYLAKYFNIVLPELEIPAQIPPPCGFSWVIRHTPY
jgi:hypothetical protein